MKLAASQLELIITRLSAGYSRHVVLVDVGGRKDIPTNEYNANIYCLDDEGSVVWQINAPAPRVDRDSFVSLRIEDSKLRADRFFGAEYLIDAETGEAVETGWHK